MSPPPLATAPPQVTAPLVVTEGHGRFLPCYDDTQVLHPLALEFLALTELMTPLRVLPVGPVEIQEARAYLRRFTDQLVTLADAVGLHLMAERGIDSCWSTDRHLDITGVPLVIHTV